jgi:hypothetical protein
MDICAESGLSGEKAHADIWRYLMTVRTSRKSVTFTQPFSLTGIDEVQPAGTYTVETDEELLPGLSFPAYRRVATLIFLRSRGGGPIVEEVVNIDPLELQAAQERDAGRHTLAEYHGGYLDQNNGPMN